MARTALFLALLGLALATGLLVWSGWHGVLDAVAAVGWGIPLVAAIHLAFVAVSAAGWRVLVPGRRAPSFAMFGWFMWVRAAVNNLMPVARIGGEVVAIRLMVQAGMRRTAAIASTVVELTLSVLAIFLFVSAGTFTFALHVADPATRRTLLWGIVLAAPALVMLAAAQRIGLFRVISGVLRGMLRDKWQALSGDPAHLDRAIASIYRRTGRIAAGGVMQLIAWTGGIIEIFLTLRFLEHPLPWGDCFMLEALMQGTSSAAFAVPGALGVQEAGFLLFGTMLGLSRETAAACALVRRCRDLLCYVPALLLWQAREGRRLWTR